MDVLLGQLKAESFDVALQMIDLPTTNDGEAVSKQEVKVSGTTAEYSREWAFTYGAFFIT